MVKYEPVTLDGVFAALADPTRRAITQRLAASEASVSELAEPFDMTLPAISKHLGVLEQAGLIERRKEGRVRYCRLVPGPLELAEEWIAHYLAFWNDRFTGLHDHLRRENAE